MQGLNQLHIADLHGHLLEVCTTGQHRDLVHLLDALVPAAERVAE